MSSQFFFLTTLRDLKNVNDQGEAVEILNQTISSVLNQSLKNIKILIVCNQVPDLATKDERVLYHVVDTTLPINREECLRDKGIKLVLGLKFIQRENPRYVFIIDSDDWVHRDLAKHVMAESYIDFWFVDRGYIVNKRQSLKTEVSGLCRYCGTSYVYDFNKLINLINIAELPIDIDEAGVVEKVDPFVYCNLLGNHKSQFSFFDSNGHKLQPIPFPSVCWVVNTGENQSKKKMSDSGFPFSSKFIRDFGVKEYEKNDFRVFFCLRSLMESLVSRVSWVIRDSKKVIPEEY